MRKPRLNSAVATVAVETVLSLVRVASLSFDIPSLSVLPSPLRGGVGDGAANNCDNVFGVLPPLPFPDANPMQLAHIGCATGVIPVAWGGGEPALPRD